MCGITGIIAPNAKAYEPHVRRMMNAIAHRGPDGSGLEISNSCVLGHLRLAIVDLAGGAQPMFNDRRSTMITFNGEIYGYKEVKKNLASYPFKTSSDTEVILALYEKYGEDFLKHLPGMFAFGLWDEDQKTFIAARDRFGEKPFYYACGPSGELLFGSEIKAILASNLIKPELDPESLAHYLRKLYIHPTKTIYKNIFVLPPAHQLVWKNGQISISRYWHMPELNPSITLEQALPKFKKLFEEAVQKQLEADVPVGAFLSGGIDSTTVVSVASKLSPHIKTFSFGYEGTKNELSFAKMTAEQYNTDHYELHDTEQNIADLIVKMAEVYDEPLADSSTISTYVISKLTREHTTVVLSGDGGDELLGGYQGWYRPILAMTDPGLKNFPGKVLLMKILAQVALRRNWKRKVAVINSSRGLQYRNMYSRALDAHRQSNVFFKPKELEVLGVTVTPTSAAPSWNLSNSVNDAMRDDVQDYMPGDILVKTDRASMAHSLELRSPFLDVPFAEFVLTLPQTLKLSDSEEKLILRQAFGETWPERIRTRNKQGFGAPVELWMNRPEVAKLIDEYMNDPQRKIFKYISFEKSRRYVREKKYKLWILLTLSIWMEKHDFS